MQVRWLVRSLVAAVTLSPAAGLAQGVQPSASATASGVSVWIDGSYRSINVPAFSLGVRESDATLNDLGPVQRFKPRVSGEGVSGGIGFVLPDGAVPAAFGSNVRVGVSGGYVRADARQTGFTTSQWPIQMWLDGVLFFGCGCEYSSDLVTKYSGWRFGVNGASDIRIGSVTWTPSIEFIGGRSKTRQTLTQIDSFEVYVANTNLNWSDIGVKLGLGMSVPVTPAFEVGIGGTLALLHRRARLSGNDSLDDDLGPIYASSVATSATTFAVVPGGKVEFAYRPHAQATIRLFGGVEWDSRVPGIVSPHFTPEQFLTLTGDPVRIGFSGQMSYFAGGGFSYAFSR